jgi:FKBP12-rapamycin complex-associated protein
MRVLRGNKDSVMAMLEAFVHDPLINWRLLNTPEADADSALASLHPDAGPAGKPIAADMQMLQSNPEC